MADNVKYIIAAKYNSTYNYFTDQVGNSYDSLSEAKSNCPPGYKVFDNSGNQLYEVPLYIIAITYYDERFIDQIGDRYQSLDDAKNNCPPGYRVFDNNGKQLYEAEIQYVIGTAYVNGKCQNQQGDAYSSLTRAQSNCKPGYKVFDTKGNQLYSVDLLYYVCTGWSKDNKGPVGQLGGSYTKLGAAEANCPPGYKVYNNKGEQKYSNNKTDETKAKFVDDKGNKLLFGQGEITYEDGQTIKYDAINIKDFSSSTETEPHKEFYHESNLFTRNELYKGIFDQRYRYGVLNPYDSLTTSREILFFTKPDLNLIKSSKNQGDPSLYESSGLHKTLANYGFFRELKTYMPEILWSLQSSATEDNNPFINLLGNMVQSNLDLPATSADMIETPSNIYGVSYKYRGSSEAGDDNHTFSLEFKDTKYLPVYRFFKAYDLYEILKHHGSIAPVNYYITNKILHDQYSIYKFILDEDMETILYYAKYYGVKSVNLPRDVFNTTTFDNGISYSIDFDAAFVEDMNPQILQDFNFLAYNYWSSLPQDIPVFNLNTGKVDMRSAKCAIVCHEVRGAIRGHIIGTGNDYINPYNQATFKTTAYKLKWKGDKTV